jgi:hypothetical protein
MSVLMIFLDGIGLGQDDPEINPFARLEAPTLHSFSGGQRWLEGLGRIESERAIFLPTDAVLGVEKMLPGSGTGQATILTGRNIPQEIGEHYGPKPNIATRQILEEDNLFLTLAWHKRRGSLITPYPPKLRHDIGRGKTLPSSLQYAALTAKVPLLTEEDYMAGRAISPDWTGEGWRNFLGFPEAPLYTPYEAGRRLAQLSREADFTLFSTWITDEIGHRGTVEQGVEFMQKTDQALQGLLEEWRDEDGLVVITSDHGNLELMSRRKHTANLIPTVAIGGGREVFAQDFYSLADITPGIMRVLGLTPPPR